MKNSESESAIASIFSNQLKLIEKAKNETHKLEPHLFLNNQNTNSINVVEDASPSSRSSFTRSYLPSGSTSTLLSSSGSQRRSLRRSSGRRQRRILNWENLGNRNVQREPLFASESGCLLSLMAAAAAKSLSSQNSFLANIISLDAFMIDVKYLVVGISSESFVFNSELTFTMIPNLTLGGVSPSIFKSLIAEFIECGSCFKRLQLMTMRKDPNTFDHIYDGLIFKALCESVETYLISFRKFVLSFDDQTVLSLQKRTVGLRNQITTLAKILDIHPSSDGTKQLAQGSEFLVCLFKATVPITEPEVRTFLMFILKNCCQVYFSCFEKWIFQGLLIDQHKELFICFVGGGYNEKTKAHFDKAYQIRRDAVPAFLHGCETDILVCGKYTMLLRQYNSTHPIFTMDRFRLKAYVTFAEQAPLRRQCEEYIRTAKALCGPSVTVAQVLKAKDQKRAELQKLVAEKAKQNQEKWRVEQEAHVIELNRVREQQREELRLQMEEIREQKFAEKKANILRELAYLKEAQELEDQQLLAENVERRKRIEYYEELNRMIEEKQARTEKLVAQLRTEIKVKEKGITQIDGIMAMSCDGSENLSADHDEKTKRCSLSVSSPSLVNSMIGEPEGFEPKIISKMKKSESDILNANHIVTTYELLPPKSQGVMGSSVIDHLNLITASTTVKLDKHKTLTDATVGDSDNNNVRTRTPLTDAQRNKIRALSSEFDISLESIELLEHGDLTEAMKNKARILGSNLHMEEIPKVTTDQGSNQVHELTDLQKNRMKIMSQEYELFEAAAPIEAKRRPMMSLPETARARNRRKVLESEFNIVTGEENTGASRPESRSSRTTDTPTTPDLESIPNLRIDMELAAENIPESLAIPNTAVIEQPTPESAIASNVTKDGFKFLPDTLVDDVNETFAVNSLKMKMDNKEDVVCEDFVKAMQRKIYTMMPLNLSVASTHQAGDQQAGDSSSKNDKYDELRYLDSTTLTKFFQQSVSLPLNAHMEIINGEILRLFLVDLDVIGQFKSLRNFFFMMDGEFGMTICDGLLKQLENGAKPSDLLNFQVLHSLLETALGNSFGGNDKNIEKLTFNVDSIPEEFDLGSPDALMMLSLQYKVSWPLNLILNPESLQQYSNIFKYLVKVRRLTWVLEASFQVSYIMRSCYLVASKRLIFIFQYLKESRKKHNTNFIRAPQYRRIEKVRHKLTQFMQALLNHITKTALQESWKKLKIDLAKTTSIEEIYRKHVSYLKRILFILMLKDKCGKFRDYLERAFILILKFYR